MWVRAPIRLPSSVREDSDRPFSLLTLWVTGDAIKKQYAVDQQTGRLFEVAIVVTSAELYDFGDDADGFALLPPNASMLVHASSHVELGLTRQLTGSVIIRKSEGPGEDDAIYHKSWATIQVHSTDGRCSE